tara:strand:- start:324522 stop:325880 length:1359 start_codon:yes stop_codon:yes gene_type:complete
MRHLFLIALSLCCVTLSTAAQNSPIRGESSATPYATRSIEPESGELSNLDLSSDARASDTRASDAQATDPKATTDPTAPLDARQIEERLEGDFGVAEIAATNGWIEQLNIVDWLGPLAPVAMSPFFAVTCLSGLALWGPEAITDNALLGSSGPLKSETLFFILLVLTVLTSLPRLTKVSKPFAQAVDRLETYAVIVILLAIKVISSMEASADEPTQIAMVQLGVFSFTVDTLLAIAMVINILVINSVKFFFEFLVWLTPVPFLDAVFEVCNKSLCALLMAVYAFNPAIATLLNLAILIVAALMLRWISRRVRFYRTMILDPVIARLWTAFGEPKKPELIVFPKTELGPFQPKSRLRLVRSGDGEDGWHLEEANWWMPAKRHMLIATDKPTVRRGWVMHTIEAQTTDGPCLLTFSRRYDRSLSGMAERLGLELTGETEATKPESHDRMTYEFS